MLIAILMVEQLKAKRVLRPKSFLRVVDWMIIRRKTMKEVRNNHFETELYSYDTDKCNVLSRITIDTKNYETFCRVVEVISLILEEEVKDE